MADEQFGVNPSKKISFNDGYTRDALMQSSAAAKEEDAARDRAMKSLQDAFYNSQEVTQDQGIAAALLAAIPTFGGYLIGKSVGSTEVPAGVTNIDPSKLKQTGAYAGGLAGAGIGQQAAGGYLTSVLDENKSENKVYEQIFNTEMDRAKSLEQKSNLYEARADQFNAQKAMMPLELEQYAKQQEILREGQKEVIDYQNTAGGNNLPPELMAVAARELGVPEGTPMTASQLNSITGLIEANRREEGQDIRLGGQNLIPPSVSTKQKMAGALMAEETGGRYLKQLEAVANQNPSYLERNITKTLPATELGALQRALGLYAVTLRNARESGVMTEPDYQRYSSYLQIGPLDTVSSVIGRMKELQQINKEGAQTALIAAKAGNENVSGYEKLFGFDAPTSGMSLGNDSEPKNSRGETKEQYIARRTQELLSGGQ